MVFVIDFGKEGGVGLGDGGRHEDDGGRVDRGSGKIVLEVEIAPSVVRVGLVVAAPVHAFHLVSGWGAWADFFSTFLRPVFVVGC